MFQLWCDRSAKLKRLFGVAVLVVLVSGGMPSASVHAETTIVPVVNVRSWYDSNVFRRPKQLLSPGQQAEDFSTQLSAGVDLLHKTRDIEADVKVIGQYAAYVENTDRNFFSMRLNAHVGLDQWVDQYVRGARLSVIENLRYTPEQESFFTGVREIEGDDGLVRGIQGFRANQIRNETDVRASYPISRDLAVEGGYLFGLRNIGRVQGGDIASITYFNTMVHTWYGGPRYYLTRNDSVAAVYRQSYIMQSRSEGGRNFSTSLITLAGEYAKEFQEWRASIQGGITFVEPAGRSFPSGKLEVSTRLDRDTVVRLQLSREAKPSFFLTAGAAISNVARAGISHRIYERLTVDGTVAYAYNELLPNTERTFKNFTATSKLAYALTRNITGEIFYVFQNIDSDASSVQFQYSRNQAGVMLSMEWK